MSSPTQDKESSASIALLRAAASGDLPTVEALLAAGADVNCPNEGGQTALILAAVMGREKVVAHLIEAGADPHHRDHLNLTALEWSTRRGFSDVAELLTKISPPLRPARAERKTIPAKTDSEKQSPRSNVGESEPAKLSSASTGVDRSPEFTDETLQRLAPRLQEADAATTGISTKSPASKAEAGPHVPASKQPRSGEPPPTSLANKSESQRTTSESLSRSTSKPHLKANQVVTTDSPKVQNPDPGSAVIESSPAAVPVSEEDETLPQPGVPTPKLALVDSETHPPPASNLPALPEPVATSGTSTTPIAVWILIAFVLGASAFAAYRLTQYFFRSEPPSPIAAQPEAPAVEEKPFFTVAGALAGMERNVPKPEYPLEIQNAGVAGPVTVIIRVNKNGRVISAVSTSGDQRLRAAAVEAAKQATFAPDKLAQISPRGRAISGSITYEFAAPQTTESPSATTSAAAGSASPSATTTPNSDPNAPVVGSELVHAVSNVPAADYPPRARRAGIGGTITVTIRVNRAGKVTSWRSSAGNSQLRAAAIKAARRATFSPEKLPGSGDVLGTITYNFTP